jgi:hypothetical protein
MPPHAAGTTDGLGAGTFKVTSTIDTDAGDRVIGSGRNATLIDGTSLAPTASGIFTVEGNTFGHNSVAGVNVIIEASGNPPQPDARGIVVNNNTMNGDAVLGCSLAGII